MTDLEGTRDPNAPFVPQWCIERAKENAERHGGEPETWLPFLGPTLRELEMLYGHPLPETDPRREQRRQKAVQNQRVLNPERFADE